MLNPQRKKNEEVIVIVSRKKLGPGMKEINPGTERFRRTRQKTGKKYFMTNFVVFLIDSKKEAPSKIKNGAIDIKTRDMDSKIIENKKRSMRLKMSCA